MSLALIDAREWQNRFDLETGRRRYDEGPVVSMVSRILKNNPFPGDTDEKGNHWVTKTALEMIDQYNPDLVCLSYAQQYFSNRHFDYSKDVQDELFSSVLAEANGFIEKSGYIPVMIGTGGMIPFKGTIDLSGLDGLAISCNWSARYCGIHFPSQEDLKILNSIEAIEHIATKEDWISLFISEDPELEMCSDERLMPDFLIKAKEGYLFKTMGSTLRRPVNIPGNNFTVPVSTPLGHVDDLRDIKGLIRSSLYNLNNPKIALIVIEGVGKAYFPDNSFLCSNGPGWFCMEPGDLFYFSLSKGRYQPFDYPAGYRYFDQDVENIKFPFSGYMTSIPKDTLAAGYTGKSIAVGNRSMFMHMAFGVDISIECFARNLFNQGCMAVVKDNPMEIEVSIPVPAITIKI